MLRYAPGTVRRAYCDDCRATRPFQRAFGWGTFFAILFTLGGWFLTLPFYPLRCRECGRPWSPTTGEAARAPEPPARLWGARDWLILGSLLAVLIIVVVFGIFTDRFQ